MARRLLLLVLASGSCFLPGAAHTPDDMVALIKAAEFNALHAKPPPSAASLAATAAMASPSAVNSCALPMAPPGVILRCAGLPCHTRLATHAVVTLHCPAVGTRLVGTAQRVCGVDGTLSARGAAAHCEAVPAASPSTPAAGAAATSAGASAAAAAAAAADANADAAAPIHLALRSLASVLTAMLRAETVAGKLQADLAAELATLRLTWKRQAAQVKLLMTADAAINKVALSALDTADYGLPPPPHKTQRGRAMSRALEACALAIRVAKGVAQLLVGAGVAPKPRGARRGAAMKEEAAAVAPTTTMAPPTKSGGGRRMGEGSAALRIDTSSFVGHGSSDVTAAIAAALAAPLIPPAAAPLVPPAARAAAATVPYTQTAVAAAPNPAAAAELVKLAALKNSAAATATQAKVDNEVIGFLKQLEQRDAGRKARLARKAKAQQLAFEHDARKAGTPLGRALTAIGHAVVKLRRAFSGVLSRAKQLSDGAAAAAGAIDRARVMGVADVHTAAGGGGAAVAAGAAGVGGAGRRLVRTAHHHHQFSGGGRAARAAASAAAAALGGASVETGGGADDPFVKSPALRQVATLFAEARATLRALRALLPGLQGQYDRVRSLLLREARRLRKVRTEPAAKALRTALQDASFMALCREYEQQLALKAETQTLVQRVHGMVASGGGGGGGESPPASATAEVGAENRRRLGALPAIASALSTPARGWSGFAAGALSGALIHVAFVMRDGRRVRCERVAK